MASLASIFSRATLIIRRMAMIREPKATVPRWYLRERCRELERPGEHELEEQEEHKGQV